MTRSWEAARAPRPRPSAATLGSHGRCSALLHPRVTRPRPRTPPLQGRFRTAALPVRTAGAREVSLLWTAPRPREKDREAGAMHLQDEKARAPSRRAKSARAQPPEASARTAAKRHLVRRAARATRPAGLRQAADRCSSPRRRRRRGRVPIEQRRPGGCSKAALRAQSDGRGRAPAQR